LGLNLVAGFATRPGEQFIGLMAVSGRIAKRARETIEHHAGVEVHYRTGIRRECGTAVSQVKLTLTMHEPISDRVLTHPWLHSEEHVWQEMRSEELELWSCRHLSRDSHIAIWQARLRQESARRDQEWLRLMSVQALIRDESISDSVVLTMRRTEFITRMLWAHRSRQLLTELGVGHLRQHILQQSRDEIMLCWEECDLEGREDVLALMASGSESAHPSLSASSLSACRPVIIDLERSPSPPHLYSPSWIRRTTWISRGRGTTWISRGRGRSKRHEMGNENQDEED
jgi:hypothetical protein